MFAGGEWGTTAWGGTFPPQPPGPALSDHWTRSRLRTTVRNEINDPLGSAQWSWTDSELNQYLDEWQQRLQDWFEFTWAVATTSVAAIGTMTNSNGIAIPSGTASIAINTFIPNALRAEAFYWITNSSTSSGVRLPPRTKQDLDILLRDWRWALPGDPPLAIYQDDINDIVLWPGPAIGGTLIAEFPAKLCFLTDTSTMQVPAWTRYSAKNYCAWRAFLRAGPNQDIQRANRYKAQWLRQVYRYRRMWDAYFPDKYTQLKPKQPSDAYNIAILNPPYITIIPP